MVNFPLDGFDISDHMAVRGESLESKPFSGVWSSWKRTKKLSFSSETEYIYDLFAVCNHHGHDLQEGHYTGKCFNIILFNFIQ